MICTDLGITYPLCAVKRVVELNIKTLIIDVLKVTVAFCFFWFFFFKSPIEKWNVQCPVMIMLKRNSHSLSWVQFCLTILLCV